MIIWWMRFRWMTPFGKVIQWHSTTRIDGTFQLPLPRHAHVLVLLSFNQNPPLVMVGSLCSSYFDIFCYVFLMFDTSRGKCKNFRDQQNHPPHNKLLKTSSPSGNKIINPSQVCLARNLYKPPWNKQQVVTPKPKKQSSESRGFLGLFKVGMMFFLEIRDLQREFVWSLTGKGITPLTRASSCRADDVVNALLTSRASPNASHGW